MSDRFFARALTLVMLGATAFAPIPIYAIAGEGATPSLPFSAAKSAASQPNLAFFYGPNPPVGELQAFDAVVVDPATSFDPAAHPLKHTAWIAHTSGAESAGTADAFLASEIEPLWLRGYRGFLLDTPAAVAAAGRIHESHPDARLVAGGADAMRNALPVAKSLYAVVGDSLIRALDDSGQLIDVPESLRVQRISDAQAFTQQSGVPVVPVEYCPHNDRQCARETAARLVSAGMLPYVTNKERDVVGIGRIEVLPRKILIVQDRDMKEPLDRSSGVRNLAAPLNYMGYDVEYADFSKRLPDDITPDRYAGVVAWIQDAHTPNPEAWQRWIMARIADHVPVAFMGQFGFDMSGLVGARLDLQTVGGALAAPVSEVVRDPMTGFEIHPKPQLRDLLGVRVGAGGKPLLRISANGVAVDPVALTPWGG